MTPQEHVDALADRCGVPPIKPGQDYPVVVVGASGRGFDLAELLLAAIATFDRASTQGNWPVYAVSDGNPSTFSGLVGVQQEQSEK